MQRSLRLIAAAIGLAAAGLAAPGPAAAQPEAVKLDPDQPVALIADRVSYDTETGRLMASGNVEVYYGERTLTARAITYDSRTERIEAVGPLVLRDPSGATVFADAADLDAQLRDGLVRGAKSVIGRHTRLSAVEARRIDGRYNTLSKAVYSPCKVCEAQPTPLWRIRARRIIHDEEARQIHYENAWFEVFGVPVAWTPYFRHPDPTVDRASGFLTPVFESSDNYGLGVKTPYYWVIDERSDLTVTPFITTEENVIGQIEYRRAFETGRLRLAGSLAYNDFTGESKLHGHIDTQGLFRLSDKTRWGWDIKTSSDDAFLRFFDITNEDRLTSEVFLWRYERDGFFDLRGVRFQSLRDDEPAGQIPLALPTFEARKEFREPLLEGDLALFASTQALFRNTGVNTARLSLGADWEREVILPIGLALRGFAELRGDLFFTGSAGGVGQTEEFRLAPLAGIELRYPLIAETAGGLVQIVEPIAQAIVAPYGGNGPEIPNEDSRNNEFDELNLFDENHFAGTDGFEEGPRLNLGLRYELFTNFGLRLDATAGRVLRLRDADEFSAGSGLAGSESDWVGGWAVHYDPHLSLRHRLRVSDEFDVDRNSVIGSFSYGPVELSGEYIFLDADPTIGTPLDREEVSAIASLALTDTISVEGFLQRDLTIGEFVRLGASARFQNECCALEVFVRRRFTDSEDVPASTSFGVQIELFTLGTADQVILPEGPGFVDGGVDR